MTDALLPIGEGRTELSEEDREGLIPSYISTRGELFEAEQRNITEGVLGRNPTSSELLDDHYLRELHRVMFNKVWKWAGKYRTREANIGLEPSAVAVAVRELVADARAWIAAASYEPDQLAVRFHHRLVAIHPFPNGNGRHGRIASDLLIASMGHPPFSWGSNQPVTTVELRGEYIAALRQGDAGDVAGLIAFAKS